MSFYQELPYPVLVGSGSVATTGSTENLVPGQLALVDVKTGDVLSTADLNGVIHPEVLIAMGSYHTTDKLSKFIGGLKQSTKTQDFLGKDVMEFHVSRPLPLKQDIIQLGWDGVNACDSLSFECGKSYRFKVSVSGEDVFRTFSRPLYRFIEFKTACCADGDCIDSCDDGVACKTYARKLAALINADPELQYFVKAEAVSSDYAPTAATHVLFTLSLCDNGDVVALAKVAGAYPTLKVSRISRVDSISTYQVCIPIVEDEEEEIVGPADFTPTSPILLAACGVCPTGYTTVTGSNVYSVLRPLAGTEDLNDSTAQQTFADLIGTAYETATAKTFDGATDVEVVAASDAITITAHGFKTGDKVVYADGGGTQVVGLTDTNTYYIIAATANTVKLAASAADAIAGTAIAIADGVGAAHTLTPVITATFQSTNGGTALVQLKSPAGVELSALLSDTLLFSHTEPDVCTPPANSAVAWVEGEQRYRTTRTLCLTIGKECDGVNRLAELQEFYANTPDLASAISVSQAGTCADTYTVTQYNNSCLEDGCLSQPVPEFDPLQSFEGVAWTEECPCPEAEEEDPAVLCGVRITGAYADTRFGDCTFEPTDYFSVRPLRINIQQLDESGNPCTTGTKVTKIQNGQVATQSGEWLRRQYLKGSSLEAYNIWNNDPRIREVFDTQFLNFIDKNKSYVVYYIVYTMNRNRANWATMHPSDKFETMVAFPVGTDATNFENLFGGYFAQFGVVLKERGV
jgi:hypothetical protein